MSDLIKQSEENVVRIAREIADFNQILTAFQRFGSHYCHTAVAKDQFFEGLSMMQNAIYKEWIHAISNCFIFAGVGGEASAKYSRERFEKVFSEDERLNVMQFLDRYGNIPYSYKVDEDKQLRKDAKKRLQENDKNE